MACSFAWVFGIAAAAWGAWAGLNWRTQAVDLHLQTSSLLAAAASSPATPPPTDFTANMGLPTPSGQFLHMLDGAATRAGASVAAVTVSERPASPNELGRTELAVQLTGSYAATRQVLQELHDRLPALQVRQLKLQAASAQGPALQASVLWSLWSAPQVAPSAVGR